MLGHCVGHLGHLDHFIGHLGSLGHDCSSEEIESTSLERATRGAGFERLRFGR